MKIDEIQSAQKSSSPSPFNGSQIGYILKGYPRTSETFITNEIHLLETLGLKLSIFSIKRLTGQQRHAVVNAIRAPVIYLPQVPLLGEVPFIKWLAISLPKFIRSHWRLCRSRPRDYLKTLREAITLSFKYRAGSWLKPRKAFIKEFLQAGYIAQQVLESGQIRHLHAHFCHTATSIAMFASRLCGLPFSFTAHAKDIYLRQLNPGDLLRTKMGQAKFIVTCTEDNRAYLEGIGPGGVPIYVSYHGLDTELFAPPARVTGHHPDQPVPLILSVGRFVEKKGFTYLVEACRRLKDQGHEFQCQLIGGADAETDRVRSRIQELQLEDTVLIRPAVTQEELRQIYRQGTVFVLPCQIVESGDRDGIPNVLVEAMAQGLPVVSTNISGIPELIDQGVNGLLVPQKDAAALAEAVEALLVNPSLRRELGKAAREKVCRRFDAKENILKLYDLFRSCLNEHEEVHQPDLQALPATKN